MNDAPSYVTVRDYLRVVREHRVLVILITLLFLGSAVVYSARQEPTYQAEAAVEFRGLNRETSILGQNVDVGGETPEQRAAVNAATLVRPEVLDRAAEILRDPNRASQLAAAVTARPEARTHLVIVQGTARTAEESARVANAVARAAVAVTRDEVRDGFEENAEAQRRVLRDVRSRPGGQLLALQLRQTIARLDELARTASPAVVRREATAPSAPIRPKPIRTALLGLIMGLTLGIVAAFVRDSLDRRFKTSREITEEMHLPLLAYVPEDVLGSSLADDARGKSLSGEQLEGFRVLRTNVEFLEVDNPPKVVLVTSALPEEGKSTVSSALAATCAVAGQRTLLVECDLRRPTIAGRLGIKTAPGLSDYLAGKARPRDVLQTISIAGASANGDQPGEDMASVPLVAIVAGSPAPRPAELLRSNRCREFFDQVRPVYDVIVVDSCPLLSVADTLELLPLVDAVIVCVRASKTTRDQARAAKAALSHFPDRPTGVVVTGVRSSEQDPAYGYYSYGYVYGSR